MPSESDILKILKEAAFAVYQVLRSCDEVTRSSARYSVEWPRELKAQVDQLADRTIFDYLRPIKLPILSEEVDSEESYDLHKRGLIVDPIDGTQNFVHALPLSCVSIGLCVGGAPARRPVCRLHLGRLRGSAHQAAA